MLFEIGSGQAADLCEIAKQSGWKCEIFKDYDANDRVAYLHK